MKFAVPLSEGKLAEHFGHCKNFAMVETDDNKKQIVNRNDVTAPPHQPGVLPAWVAGQGVNVVIAGGIGAKARQLLNKQGVEVLIGAPVDVPELLVDAYLNGSLKSGPNLCDH
jgi:predicted Fe-Mo cluster-binding NifX family protein